MACNTVKRGEDRPNQGDWDAMAQPCIGGAMDEFRVETPHSAAIISPSF
jgi:hypothetical protein